MNLTVTARIAGGAGIVIVLLIALAFTGISGVNSINEGLQAMTQKSAPMLVDGSETQSTLLKANLVVNRFHQSRVLSDLTELESQYNDLMQSNRKSVASLSDKASSYPGIDEKLKKSAAKIQEYQITVPKMFDIHRQDLKYGEQIANMRGNFEENADELDSLLYDFSEEAELASTGEALQKMSGMIQEATVTVTDALLVKESDKVIAASKDIQALVVDLEKRFQTVSLDSRARSSEYYEDTQKALNTFKSLVTGDQSILRIYVAQLNAQKEAASLLSDADNQAVEALEFLKQMFEGVKAENDRIEKVAHDKVGSSRTLLTVFAVVAIIAAVGINFWVVTSIRSPLNEVVRVINKASSGDLTDKAQVESEDEIGSLAQGFNGLIEALRNMLQEIGNSSHQLSSSAEQTAAISRQSNENISHQKEQTDMVATAMTEMTATVNEVANSANSTLQEVQKANTETSEGQQVVQQSISTINKLASEIESAAQVIDKLDEYSTNIGAVLDVIRGIADQTNLLALNAAIEAARAGEQGRGFAVVADEVRTLASKTQESTSEIQDMIERLQSGTREAVSVMETSRQEAQNSVAQTESAGHSLQRITQAVEVINDMSTHIASAAEEQSAVTQEMHQNIEAISEVADQTAAGSSENLQASQELARLAEHLQQLVTRFKY